MSAHGLETDIAAPEIDVCFAPDTVVKRVVWIGRILI